MFNQLAKIHSCYNPPLSPPAQYLSAPGPVQLLLVYSSRDRSLRLGSSQHYYYCLPPAAPHLITRAQFLPAIYPAPHLPQRFTRSIELGFSKIYLAPHLPTQAWPIKVTHSIYLSPRPHESVCPCSSSSASLDHTSHFGQATITKSHDIVITEISLNISIITNEGV